MVTVIKTFQIHLDDGFTVHRSITLVHFQLDAKNSYLFIYNTQCITERATAGHTGQQRKQKYSHILGVKSGQQHTTA
jgi:hypothetical protein